MVVRGGSRWGRWSFVGGLALGLALLVVVWRVPFLDAFRFYVDFFVFLVGLAVVLTLAGGVVVARRGGLSSTGWLHALRVAGVLSFVVLVVGAVLVVADSNVSGVPSWELWGAPFAAASGVALLVVSVEARLGARVGAAALAVFGAAALAGGDHFWSGLGALFAAPFVALLQPSRWRE